MYFLGKQHCFSIWWTSPYETDNDIIFVEVICISISRLDIIFTALLPNEDHRNPTHLNNNYLYKYNPHTKHNRTVRTSEWSELWTSYYCRFLVNYGQGCCDILCSAAIAIMNNYNYSHWCYMYIVQWVSQKCYVLGIFSNHQCNVH